MLQVKSGTIFDNFLITNDPNLAEEVGNDTWGKTKVRQRLLSFQTTSMPVSCSLIIMGCMCVCIWNDCLNCPHIHPLQDAEKKMKESQEEEERKKREEEDSKRREEAKEEDEDEEEKDEEEEDEEEEEGEEQEDEEEDDEGTDSKLKDEL